MSNYDHDIREFYIDKMPQRIKDLVHQIRHDLWNGPIYVDEEGEECSCFDEGATQFTFDQACAEVTEWADETLDPLYMEPWCGYWSTFKPENEEPVGYDEDEDGNEVVVFAEVEAPEYVFMDVPEIKRILFGELAAYI